MKNLYPFRFKIWKFVKASAPGLAESKQSPIQEIGAMQRRVKLEVLAQGKTKS